MAVAGPDGRRDRGGVAVGDVTGGEVVTGRRDVRGSCNESEAREGDSAGEPTCASDGGLIRGGDIGGLPKAFASAS